MSFSRTNREEMFCEKGVLRKLAKFTGKHLCQSLFFNNITGVFLGKPFLAEHLWTTASTLLFYNQEFLNDKNPILQIKNIEDNCTNVSTWDPRSVFVGIYSLAF